MRGADRVTRIVRRPRRQSEDGRRRFGQGGKRNARSSRIHRRGQRAGGPRVVPAGQGRLLRDLRRQDAQRLARLRQGERSFALDDRRRRHQVQRLGRRRSPDGRGRRPDLRQEVQELRTGDGVEGLEGRQLGHLLPGPGGYDPEGRQDQIRADLHLVPRVSGARQCEPPRRQTGR